jgi:hypothetical protein
MWIHAGYSAFTECKPAPFFGGKSQLDLCGTRMFLHKIDFASDHNFKPGLVEAVKTIGCL